MVFFEFFMNIIFDVIMFQSPVIMQSVKSTQVAKPVLQTAGAPLKPVNPVMAEQAVQAPAPAAPTQTVVAPDRAAQMETPPPPSYEFSIQQKQQQVRMLLQHIFLIIKESGHQVTITYQMLVATW